MELWAESPVADQSEWLGEDEYGLADEPNQHAPNEPIVDHGLVVYGYFDE